MVAPLPARPPLVVRSPVPVRTHYAQYRDELRGDFWFACAYCSMTELEACGIGYAIDHYQPQDAGGGDNYANLYWSCQQCNRTKSSYWPQPGDPPSLRIIQIDAEHPDDHFDTDAEDVDRLVDLTALGKFNIAFMRLNRSRMLRLRKLRRESLHSESAIRSGLRTLSQMRLDDLPGRLKARAHAIRTRLSHSATAAEDLWDRTIRTLVEEASKSELLDDDENPHENRERKEYLKRVGAFKKPKR